MFTLDGPGPEGSRRRPQHARSSAGQARIAALAALLRSDSAGGRRLGRLARALQAVRRSGGAAGLALAASTGPADDAGQETARIHFIVCPEALFEARRGYGRDGEGPDHARCRPARSAASGSSPAA